MSAGDNQRWKEHLCGMDLFALVVLIRLPWGNSPGDASGRGIINAGGRSRCPQRYRGV